MCSSDLLLQAAQMPLLVRRDFVANSNDSFWLANDIAPQRGFPAIVGAVDEPQSLRTRQGLLTIHRAISEHPVSGGGITPAVVKEMIFGNDSLAAELALDDLLTLCEDAAAAQDSHGEAVDLTEACAVLRRWDRRMDLDSRGAALFAEFFMPLSRQPGGFPAATVPFDPADPLHTPRGLDLAAAHAQSLRTGLADAVRALAARGVALDAPWGSVQHEIGRAHV